MKTVIVYLGQDPAYGDMPMVELNYIKDFSARITERGPNYLILDRTTFYAEGGGQPFDMGILSWEGGSTKVYNVQKEGSEVRHYVRDSETPDEVTGELDWERRYRHMRHHTAQHLLSGLVFQRYGAKTAGNSLGLQGQVTASRAAGSEKTLPTSVEITNDTLSRRYIYYSHVDFARPPFEPEEITEIEAAFNGVVARELPVTIYEEDRQVLEERIEEERAILELIPKSIRRLRVIQIGDVDLCPCGGTHVRNVSEVGQMHILRRRSKGKGVDRITYELV